MHCNIIIFYFKPSLLLHYASCILPYLIFTSFILFMLNCAVTDLESLSLFDVYSNTKLYFTGI